MLRLLIITLWFGSTLAAFLLWQAGWAWWAALAVVVVGHLPGLLATLIPKLSWWGPLICHFKTNERAIWLTIDDGPDPQDTPFILETLDQHQAKATFFVIGEKARKHPELITEILKRGHQVANHTQTHPKFWFWAYGRKALTREISQCQETLAEIAPKRISPYFRAPAGLRGPFLHKVLASLDLTLVCWSHRGLDGVSTNRQAIVHRLTRDVKPGSILLMHEGIRDQHGRSIAQDCVPLVLSALRDQGFRCNLPLG